jgi:GNAT superfamily N-acetyltransferase
MKIIAATLDDIPELINLLALLFTQEADFKPNPHKQIEGLKQIINQPQVGRILVLRDEKRILAMVNVLFTVSTALGGLVAILEDMIVHPDVRGHGAGSALLQYAIDFAKTNGCLRITLLTDDSNATAIRFYERQGFQRSRMLPLRLLLQ